MQRDDFYQIIKMFYRQKVLKNAKSFDSMKIGKNNEFCRLKRKVAQNFADFDTNFKPIFGRF